MLNLTFKESVLRECLILFKPRLVKKKTVCEVKKNTREYRNGVSLSIYNIFRPPLRDRIVSLGGSISTKEFPSPTGNIPKKENNYP